MLYKYKVKIACDLLEEEFINVYATCLLDNPYFITD